MASIKKTVSGRKAATFTGVRGTYIGQPCTECGAILKHSDTDDCVSCTKKASRPFKPETQYAKRLMIDDMKALAELKKLEREQYAIL